MSVSQSSRVSMVGDASTPQGRISVNVSLVERDQIVEMVCTSRLNIYVNGLECLCWLIIKDQFIVVTIIMCFLCVMCQVYKRNSIFIVIWIYHRPSVCTPHPIK